MLYRNLQAEMARKGYSRRSLSRMTGIPYSTINQWLGPAFHMSLPFSAAVTIGKLFPDVELEVLFATEDERGGADADG